MTIRVVDTDDDTYDYLTATNWYVDENNNIHIMSDDVELHCHRRGLWAYVMRLSEPALGLVGDGTST